MRILSIYFVSAEKKFMYDLEKHVDVFKTFIQALLSQAVDDGFLQAVMDENGTIFKNFLG